MGHIWVWGNQIPNSMGPHSSQIFPKSFNNTVNLPGDLYQSILCGSLCHFFGASHMVDSPRCRKCWHWKCRWGMDCRCRKNFHSDSVQQDTKDNPEATGAPSLTVFERVENMTMEEKQQLQRGDTDFYCPEIISLYGSI